MSVKKLALVLAVLTLMSMELSAFRYFAKTYGTPGASESMVQFALGNDGSYVLCGTSSGEGPICIKVDSTGDIEWYRSYSTCGCSDVISTSDGNFIMVSPCSGDTFRVIKFTQDGETQWDKRYIVDGGYSKIKSIRELNGYFYIGFHISFDSAGIVKLNSNGGLVWSKVYDIEGYTDEQLSNLEIADDSILIITFSMSDQNRFGVTKISQDGDVGWNRVYSRETATMFKVFDILRVPDGYFVVGCSDTLWYLDAFILKINNQLNVEWAKSFNLLDKHDSLVAVIPTSDGNFVALGIQEDADPNGQGFDYTFFMKFNSSGNILWTRRFRKVNEGYYGVNIMETPGGQLVFAGNKNVYNMKDYLLVTMQSDGTFPGSCEYFGDESRTTSSLVLTSSDKPVSSQTITVTEDTVSNSCPFDVNTLCESSTGLGEDGGPCAHPSPYQGATVVHGALQLKKIQGVTYQVWRPDGHIIYEGKGTKLLLPNGVYFVDDGSIRRKVLVIK